MSDTAEVSYCARHPKVVTYLKCASCGTPICPDCSKLTSVGYKCKECGTNKNSPVYQLTPLQGLAGGLVGLACGLLAGLGVGALGFLAIWLAFPYGRLAGSLILRASGRKLGIGMEIITGVSITLGAITGLAVLFALRYPAIVTAIVHHGTAKASHGPTPMLFLLAPSIYGIIALIIIIATAVARIRYVWDIWGF